MIENSLEIIEQYVKDPYEKLRSLTHLKKDAMQLENRSSCPVCDQDLPFKIDKKGIEKIDSKILEIQTIVRNIQAKKRKKAEKIALERKKKDEALRKKASLFLKENRRWFTKTVKQYYNQAIDDPLIHVREKIKSIEEKQIWNKAMEIYLDSPGRIDLEFEDELFFDPKSEKAKETAPE